MRIPMAIYSQRAYLVRKLAVVLEFTREQRPDHLHAE
jgi:hypothetical protein